MNYFSGYFNNIVTHDPKNNMVILNRELVKYLLTLDSIETKYQSWERVDMNGLDRIVRIGQENIGNDILFIPSRIRYYQLQKEDRIIEFLYNSFTLLPYIFDICGNKIVLAGGSLFYATTNSLNDTSIDDVDLFFVNIDNEEQFLYNLLDKLSKIIIAKKYSYVFSRNKHVTTLYVIPHETDDILTYKEIMSHYNVNKYQFIHRNYESPMHVIGGFDIPSLYFDGHHIYTNRLGAFCCVNKIIIINIKKRSTSYSVRLSKYYLKYNTSLVLTNCTNKELNDYLIEHNPVHFKLCKDLYFHHNHHSNKNIRNSDQTYPFEFNYILSGAGYQYNQKSDYESNIYSANYLTANALMAAKGKTDYICWYGKNIDTLFNNSHIDYILPVFLLVPHLYGHTIIINRWMNKKERLQYTNILNKTITTATEEIEKNNVIAVLKMGVRSRIENTINNYKPTILWRTKNDAMVQYSSNNSVSHIDEPLIYQTNSSNMISGSINPIITNVSEYYHPAFQTKMYIGLSDKIVLTILLAWKKHIGVFETVSFNRDVFKLLMSYLNYANASSYVNDHIFK